MRLLAAALFVALAAPAFAQTTFVSGPTRIGDPVPAGKPPVIMGGIDASGNAQAARVTAGGAVSVDGGASGSPAAAACKTVSVNAQGVAGADVVVDATAGGIAVLAASATRCGASIQNSGAADMRCAPAGLAPTATIGFLVPAGRNVDLGPEGQQLWKCIRTAAVSTAASVLEATP